MAKLMTYQQVTEDAPVFSYVQGDPIDTLMKEDSCHRWIAIVVLLADSGATVSFLAKNSGHSKSYIRQLLKGEIADAPLQKQIAWFLDLPVEQVFCY